jgi:hypothetical protein
MKRIFLIIAAFLFSAVAIAQPPKLFKYQGLARDSSGNPISNDTIALRISIHQGTPAGTVVYKETHNPITNVFGSFSINIGGGTVVTGNFLTIPWSRYNYFQEVEMDATGGTSFISMGTSQYLSVPYALATDSAAHSLLADSSLRSFHAIKADSAFNGIAPFWVQNNSSGNDSGSVAIFAFANGGGPAIFCKNNGPAEGLFASGTRKSFRAECTNGIYFWVDSVGIVTNGRSQLGGNVIIQNDLTVNGTSTLVGNVQTIGNLHVNGTLSKFAGSFKIDHPLDPANKFLYHSFVESPDMKNIYDGTVTTDADGNAVVELPAYFEVLNKDFRYQLTAMGQFAQAIVSEEISDNKFSIKTDKPNVKISWQVTGIRKDAYAEKNRIVPEVEKSKEEKGKYLYPDAYRQVPEKK